MTASQGLARVLVALVAGISLVMALGLAAWHPVAPAAVLAGVWLVTLGTAWRPGVWLFWLPALFPVLNFYPWTGWWLVDESDLLVLAVVAGAYGRWACAGVRVPARLWSRWRVWWWVVMALCVGQALWRGWAAAPPLPPSTGPIDALWQGLFADHLSAWNGVRVAKAFVWALLLAPLVWRAWTEDRSRAGLAYVHGLLVGLLLVGALVLWERETQVGLLDFVSGYRTAAAFWEMHVGGGAIDAYLALTAPLVLWLVWVAPSRWRWWMAQGMLWLTTYVLLTTYSRGVMGAFAIAIMGWGLAAWRLQQPRDGQGPGRRRVVAAALLALVVQGGAVLVAGAYLGGRLEDSSRDLLGRWAHWQRGVQLLEGLPSHLAWGAGMGRFTAGYRAQGIEGELPGRAVWARGADGMGHLVLHGPDSRDELSFQFGLMQRVSVQQAGGYVARVRLSGQPGDEVVLSLCQRYLLHTVFCQWGGVTVDDREAEGDVWQTVRLHGPAFPVQGVSNASGDGYTAALVLHATRASQVSRVHAVELLDAHGRQLLHNPDFAEGLGRWMPAAEGYFQPWHIDNLYIDVLLELGLVGWMALSVLVLAALRGLYRGLLAQDVLAWAYGAPLLGFLSVGVLISVTEVPRVFLLALLATLLASGSWTKEG